MLADCSCREFALTPLYRTAPPSWRTGHAKPIPEDVRSTRVGSTSFTLKQPKREVLLRVCGVIDLSAGAVLVLLGLALSLARVWIGGLGVLLGGFLGLWAGSMMTWGRVHVNSKRLVTTQNRPHRAKREDILSIDICRSDFGKI